jgi:hypothetical protein
MMASTGAHSPTNTLSFIGVRLASEFHNLDGQVLLKALQAMEKQAKCQVRSHLRLFRVLTFGRHATVSNNISPTQQVFSGHQSDEAGVKFFLV